MIKDLIQDFNRYLKRSIKIPVVGGGVVIVVVVVVVIGVVVVVVVGVVVVVVAGVVVAALGTSSVSTVVVLRLPQGYRLSKTREFFTYVKLKLNILLPRSNNKF